MPQIDFKLTEANGQKRRIKFPERPSWAALATRLSELYSLPIQRIGVAYTDPEGDEITLNSQAELDDFYDSHPSDQTISFLIKDLSARDVAIHHRSIDDPEFPDWQGLDVETGAHGVIEQFPRLSLGGPDIATTPRIPAAEKGKEKVDYSMNTSTPGMTESMPGRSPGQVRDALQGLDTSSLNTDEGAQPELRPQDKKDEAGASTNVPEAVDDPPLPEFPLAGDRSAPQSHPSFIRDFGDFLAMFNTAITSHPELGEAFRNLVQNSAQGVYWAAQRESIAHSAEQLAQNTARMAEQFQRTAEAEGHHRIAYAFDGLFRGFSQAIGATPQNPQQNTTNNLQSGDDADRRTTFIPPSFANFPSSSSLPPHVAATPRSATLSHHSPQTFTVPLRRHTTDDVLPTSNIGSPSASESKAKLRAAKSYYKAEREKYKEQRRKQKENQNQEHTPSVSNDIAGIARNPQGEYSFVGPVPPHDTHTSRPHPEHAALAEEQVVNRLLGFGLPAEDYRELVRDLLRSDNALSEDEIASRVIEHCFSEAAQRNRSF